MLSLGLQRYTGFYFIDENTNVLTFSATINKVYYVSCESCDVFEGIRYL